MWVFKKKLTCWMSFFFNFSNNILQISEKQDMHINFVEFKSKQLKIHHTAQIKAKYIFPHQGFHVKRKMTAYTSLMGHKLVRCSVQLFISMMNGGRRFLPASAQKELTFDKASYNTKGYIDLSLTKKRPN